MDLPHQYISIFLGLHPIFAFKALHAKRVVKGEKHKNPTSIAWRCSVVVLLLKVIMWTRSEACLKLD